MGLIAGLSAFGMASVVPSLPGLARAFDRPLGDVQFVVSIYLLGLGLFQPFQGMLSDRFGRRPMFVAFLIGAAAIVPVYALLGRNQTVLLLAGPLVGFFGHGYFSVFGSMLAELFPTSIRATAQGFAYNAGRAVSALAPYSIGRLADRHGFGVALASTSAFFVLGAVLVLLLPETRGRALEEAPSDGAEVRW